jgi:8-oxo-dGTP pyrophosphatase MutT (NUDIX family)
MMAGFRLRPLQSICRDMMQTDKLLAALDKHIAYDADEEIHRRKIIAFVEQQPRRWWKRSTLEGHITASAWVLNVSRSHALLLHHAKLDCWVQPGGHVDDSDASVSAGALREAMEETGLTFLSLPGDSLFDVDIHSIPERKNEPAHLHYDLRYLIISGSTSVTVSDESLGARWIPLEELTQSSIERSISRMAEKSLRMDPS